MGFPVVQAGVGESVTNDQRGIIEVPDDVDVVDGAVVKSSKSVAVGESSGRICMMLSLAPSCY